MTGGTDRLSCPRCGMHVSPDDVPLVVGGDEQVRFESVCPDCETMLEVVAEADPDHSELVVWVEDQRDDKSYTGRQKDR